MEVLALDIETTGLDPEKHQIIEIAAIFADVDREGVHVIGAWRALVDHPLYYGDPGALAMHGVLFAEIARRRYEPYSILRSPEDVWPNFLDWVESFGPPERKTLLGKNLAGYDLRFLEKLPGYRRLHHHRILDVGSMFVRAEDVHPPDLEECLLRAGVVKDVSHTALEDCRDCLACLHAHFRGGHPPD